MKINTSNPALDAYQRMAVAQVGATRGAPAATSMEKSSATGDEEIAKVSISSQARSMAANGAQAGLDVEKVERVRAALESNQLSFDSTRIAERMIRALG
jgi:flagellar biosynthesis anti-sigma factor FlgM